MKVAIIGCGAIGKKRLLALDPSDTLVGVADAQPGRARELAGGREGTRVFGRWEEAVESADVEALIVSTTNDWLAPIACAAAVRGKHVLVEKPGARSAEELRGVIAAARATRAVVHVGFNHRFHPALLKAKEIVEAGALGPLMFVRGRYGHGGRVGYDREWRADPRISGGGELLDQGSHLIDLARWFLGDFPRVSGYAATMYWDMPVEDNAFLTLRTAGDQVAWLHASCSEWKNMFSFEIYGRDGKLAIDGLGGSYGTERLSFYKMLPRMGPPDTTIWEYPGADASWSVEYQGFRRAVQQGTAPAVSLEDALAVLETIGAVYAQMRPGS
jgi:predicted dehydrogenase